LPEQKQTSNVTYEAPWTPNLAHRSDPNRVRVPETPPLGAHEPHPGRGVEQVLPPGTATATPARQPPTGLALAHDPQSIQTEPSYYDIPILKPPVWKWEIALYFFLGGLSGGAYALTRLASRFGDERFTRLKRIGPTVALATLIPCPPLLIADLGDPKRFHHMLRVFKPGSPMNFGSWVLTAYGGMATFEVVRQFINSRPRPALRGRERSLLRKLMNNGTLLLAHDAAGVPFALLVASYPGVLLSCTSNPLWCKNPWLSPLFAASAVSTGAEALSLALDCWPGSDRDADAEAAQPLLMAIDTAAHAAELMLMRGFLNHAGEKARPLRSGGVKNHHRFATGAILAAEALKRIPTSERLRKPARMLIAALGLAGGLALRWAMVFGGREAAADPQLSRLVNRSENRS
jgi:formate-dependent nitrite reductase membrane component NrfD